MKYAVLVLSVLFSVSGFAARWTQRDALRTAVAMREGLAKGYDLQKIVEADNGILLDEDRSECVSLIYSKEPNIQCPDEPFVGPFLIKASMTCFKKGAEQDVKVTALMESRCDDMKFSSGVYFRSVSGSVLRGE